MFGLNSNKSKCLIFYSYSIYIVLYIYLHQNDTFDLKMWGSVALLDPKGSD